MIRIATDMGGTFTDLVVERAGGRVELFKSPTTPDEPLTGVLDAVRLAADGAGVSLEDLLADTATFIHGTTRSLNAVLTGATARTAFLTTAGHPDVLLFREGGRVAPFDFTRPYPRPWVARDLTFEVPGRIGADGGVVRPLDEEAMATVLDRLEEAGVEAVAVCLLWSVVNPEHELRVAELVAQRLPNLPVTLSHVVNPVVREYRRASSTVLDASLKPLMGTYLRRLHSELARHGFRGRLLVNTSAGGVQDAEDVAAAPIHTLNSGPAMAPVAGRSYVARDLGAPVAIVADTGGTSYDVSVVRDGRIPVTQDSWIGEPYVGQMTGFPGVDVRSVGAGGGSIAWVDDAGMLRVGPRSAGSEPGPACYGRAGTEPTVTDACLLLGFIDPDYFLGGRMRLDLGAARAAMERAVAGPLGLEVVEAAQAVLSLATEHMVGAIEEITLEQGISARGAVLVGGGGAAGFNSVAIARRLGCSSVIVPALGSVLSAGGALMSDLSSEFARTCQTSSDRFAREEVNEVLADLRRRCEEFARGPGSGAVSTEVELVAGARYPSQVWELEVVLGHDRFEGPQDVAAFVEEFHRVHAETFATSDPGSEVEVVTWRARVRCRIQDQPLVPQDGGAQREAGSRTIHLPSLGAVDVPVLPLAGLSTSEAVPGPLVVESPVTTVVVDERSSAVRTSSGSVVITLGPPSTREAGR